eukprot:COSAG06_NODE_390_length_16395_cov_6.904332_6_plen_298_part_00
MGVGTGAGWPRLRHGSSDGRLRHSGECCNPSACSAPANTASRPYRNVYVCVCALPTLMSILDCAVSSVLSVCSAGRGMPRRLLSTAAAAVQALAPAAAAVTEADPSRRMFSTMSDLRLPTDTPWRHARTHARLDHNNTTSCSHVHTHSLLDTPLTHARTQRDWSKLTAVMWLRIVHRRRSAPTHGAAHAPPALAVEVAVAVAVAAAAWVRGTTARRPAAQQPLDRSLGTVMIQPQARPSDDSGPRRGTRARLPVVETATTVVAVECAARALLGVAVAAVGRRVGLGCTLRCSLRGVS